jgi:hypothetical protein
MGPKRSAFHCLIALASAASSVAHAASVSYNGLFIDSFGAPFRYSLDGTLDPNWRSEFGAFDVDRLFRHPLSRPFLFQAPLSRSLQFPDFNMGNFTNGNSLPGISDNSNSGLTNGNSTTGQFGTNNYLTLTGVSSGNASNIATAPTIASSNTSSNSASPQQNLPQNTTSPHVTLNTSLALSTPASSAKPSSVPKDSTAFTPPIGSSTPTNSVGGTAPALNLPLLLLNPISSPTGSVQSTGSSSPSDSVSAAPLPGAFSLFAAGLGGLGLLAWLRKRKFLQSIPYQSQPHMDDKWS